MMRLLPPYYVRVATNIEVDKELIEAKCFYWAGVLVTTRLSIETYPANPHFFFILFLVQMRT